MNTLRTFVPVIVLFVCAAIRSTAQPPPNWLTVRIMSSKLADKAQVYQGDGEDIVQRHPPLDGGSPLVIMQEGDDKKMYGYIAGEIHVSNSMMLIAECQFTNTSAADQTFHPLDIELSGKSGTLVAVGLGSLRLGSLPFAKDVATWDKLRKKRFWPLEKGKTEENIITYVFVVSKDASSWKLMYHGTQIAELKPEKN